MRRGIGTATKANPPNESLAPLVAEPFLRKPFFDRHRRAQNETDRVAGTAAGKAENVVSASELLVLVVVRLLNLLFLLQGNLLDAHLRHSDD